MRAVICTHDTRLRSSRQASGLAAGGARLPVVDPGVEGRKVDVGRGMVGQEVLPLRSRPGRPACCTATVSQWQQ